MSKDICLKMKKSLLRNPEQAFIYRIYASNL